MIPFLDVRGLSKSYRGATAVEDVSFSLAPGEILAVLGENGAGKSTLTKMIAGVVPPSHGEIIIDGETLTFDGPADALRAGIVMVFQETSLVPSMTAAQNLFLGDERIFNRLRSLYVEAQQLLQSLNFNVDPAASVASLGAAQRQMVEIARAVRKNARLIIFDEPTATLTPEEKDAFYALIKRLAARGVATILISHALEESLTHADRIMVLRDGRHVVTDVAQAFNRDRIITTMIGRDLRADGGPAEQERTARPYGPLLLSVQDLSAGRMVRNTSFSVYGGQVTGFFGLVGSGRTEAFKVVAGVTKRNFLRGGSIRWQGRALRCRSPRQAMRRGIVYVTEDRKAEGIFETMAIGESILLGSLARESPGLWRLVSREAGAGLAQQWGNELSIRSIDSTAAVLELSGGNQQKVVIAKSLVQDPQLIILDEPTRGVDVGAIQEIHAAINALADRGLAVVVISSYLPELLQLSDRLLVCRQGRVVEEFDRHEANERNIMYAAVH